MPVYLWYPILVSMGLGFTFMNIPPVNRQFMALFGVGYDGLSWFLSGLFWTHALMQLPAGIIADRRGPWTVLMAGLGIGTAANALPFLAPSSLALATAMRAFLGVGTSLSFLALMKVIVVLAPSEKLPSIQGLQGAGFSLGFVLPYAILPHLGESAWPWAYLIGAAALAAAMGLAFLLPRAALGPTERARPAAEISRAVWAIVTSRPIWFLGIFHGLSYGSLNNLGNWLPSILADLDGRGDPTAWAGAAVALLLLGTLGRACGGRLSERLTRGRAVNAATLVICCLYLAMGLAGPEYWVLGSAFLMALACGSTYGGVFTLSAEVGVGYAATSMGVMNMIGNLVNGLRTLFFGDVREYTGRFTPSLIAVGLLGLFLWRAGRGVVLRTDQECRKAGK
jgi:MFS family permease